MRLYPQMSKHQETYVDYILAHPGCAKMDVNNACKINCLAGHKWVYDGINRLIAQGIVVDDGVSMRTELRLSSYASNLVSFYRR